MGVPFVTRMSDLELFGQLAPNSSNENPNVGLLVDAFHLHAADEPFARRALARWGGRQDRLGHVADLPAGGDSTGGRDAIIDAERGLARGRAGRSRLARRSEEACCKRRAYEWAGDGRTSGPECEALVGQEPRRKWPGSGQKGNRRLLAGAAV